VEDVNLYSYNGVAEV